MPRSNKKKKAVVPVVPETSPAEEALKTSLKKRLQTRRKMMSVSRQGGSSQEVQKVMSRFNDADEEKLELMREIQSDVKNMSTKDAKKYLKKVIGTMDKEQTNNFVDMVKDKLPSQSKEIVDYVQRNKNLQKKVDDTKPKVNPETVYIPTRLMSEEQKIAARAQKQKKNITVTADTSIPAGLLQGTCCPLKKKKKTFKPINITVPKITELRSEVPEVEEEDPKMKKRQKKNPFTKVSSDVDKINNLFSEKNTQTAELKHLNFASRMQHLSKFNPKTYNDNMRQFLFEASAVVEVVTIKEVLPLHFADVLPVPNSDEFITFEQIPLHYHKLLQATPEDYVGDAKHPYLYRQMVNTLSVGQNEIQYIRAQNAYQPCCEFVKKFTPVMNWLQTLVGAQVPMIWFSENLNNLGIVEQKIESKDLNQKATSLVFRLLCAEYMHKNKEKFTVPIVPFVKIIIK